MKPSRVVVVFAVAFVLGCPAKVPRPEPKVTTPSALVAAYRSGPGVAHAEWTDRVIRCTLPAGQYACSKGGILWSQESPPGVPCVEFVCTPPADNSHAVEIVGTCRGAIYDGVDRGFGVKFLIRVSGCVFAFPE